MPAGVSWSKYLTFLFASLASALAGSQVVHLYYRPSLVSDLCYFVTNVMYDLFVFNIIINFIMIVIIVWNQWHFSLISNTFIHIQMQVFQISKVFNVIPRNKKKNSHFSQNIHERWFCMFKNNFFSMVTQGNLKKQQTDLYAPNMESNQWPYDNASSPFALLMSWIEIAVSKVIQLNVFWKMTVNVGRRC